MFNLASQSRKILFMKFKVTVRGMMLTWQEWNSFYELVILWMRMTSEVFTPQGIMIESIIRDFVIKTQLESSENTIKGVIST